ncbi:hypothetical protein QBC47DRAFT_385100 [Echria macrotheca]|uniref:Uncharacterized protein n=1 Tax=Echria macrotheca TaxID=438768 RepID=A0AAJ0B8X2_9PEZI|nr:hypothetical protein QBC47DRAFT_385100 [Echria macrotheca]
MPTVQAPQQQAPMEAANPAQANGAVVVTQQPKSEPMPSAEQELSLRGGGFNVGCSERCCGLNCSFYKGCC